MSRYYLIVFLILGHISIGHCFLLNDICLGRCGDKLDTSKSCQCNADCTQHNDCCADYHSVCNTCDGRCFAQFDHTTGCQCNHNCAQHYNCCPDFNAVCNAGTGTTSAIGNLHTPRPHHAHNVNVNSLTVSTIADALWKIDTDKFLSGEITLNYGSKTHSGSGHDVSSHPLFTNVNHARLQRPVYKAFVRLLDNYNPTRGHADPISGLEQTEINHFLDIVMATDVMKVTRQFLIHMGHFHGDEAAFRHKIEMLWFRPYRRNPHGSSDSSAFEHVFVGEYKGSSVEGFHNWLRFYLEEKTGNTNYYGYMKRRDPVLLELTFSWKNHYKKMDSFLLGSSPEFEMALDTICILMHANSLCHLKLNGVAFAIQTWDVTHISGIQIASAYTVF